MPLTCEPQQGGRAGVCWLPKAHVTMARGTKRGTSLTEVGIVFLSSQDEYVYFNLILEIWECSSLATSMIICYYR